MLHPVFLHIAVAVLQAGDNGGDIALFKRVEHTAAIPFGMQDTLKAHILQMVGSQGLF